MGDKAKKIVKALIKDIGGLVFLGNTFAELLDSLEGKYEKDALMRFTDNFSNLIQVISKIILWKDIHELFTNMLTDFGPFYGAILEHHREQFMNCSPQVKQTLMIDWKMLYANHLDHPIQVFREKIVPEGEPVRPDQFHKIELEDVEEHVEILKHLNNLMLNGFDSLNYVMDLPNLCFEFKRSMTIMARKANSLSIEYINSLKDEVQLLAKVLEEKGD